MANASGQSRALMCDDVYGQIYLVVRAQIYLALLECVDVG